MFRRLSRVPVILQAEQTECGLAALAMIAHYFGHRIDLATLRRRYVQPGHGPTLESILSVADAIGLIGRPVRLDLEELGQLSLPAILHWNFDHFVVAMRIERRGVVVHDPAAGRRFVPNKAFSDAFTGVAVEFTRANHFEADASQKVPLVKRLVASFEGLGRYLALMLVLMLVTQLLALAPPIATQLLIDEVVLGHDQSWLYKVLAGVGLVMLTTLLIDALRRWIALYTGTRLATESTASVVRHLLHLPVRTVEQRPVGDLLSRVDSLKPIRTALTDTCLNAFVQLMILTTTLLVMTYYSPGLALISVSALLLTTALHAVLLPKARMLNLEAVVASAQASNSLIESLRSFQAIDALSLDTQRLAHWQRFFIAATNATARQARIGIGASLGQGVISTIEQLLFLAIGIGGVVNNRITLGILFAFMSFRGRLNSAAIQIIAAGRELYLLRSHLERVGEIVMEKPVPPAPRAAMRGTLSGRIECDAVSFRYPGREQLLSAVSCSIAAGESVVISGPSGVGKTTLLRLLSARLQPDGGVVLFDNIEAQLWDRRALMRQFGIVLQHDRLFQGSVADNISCFEAEPDIGRIREAACLACIWRDLQELPMSVHTPVAAGGTGLSGGQVQRVLLARALYREPRVLFLDEATSHLDRATEQKVLDNLRCLKMTIISVAHRENALAKGGRSIRLGAREDEEQADT